MVFIFQKGIVRWRVKKIAAWLQSLEAYSGREGFCPAEKGRQSRRGGYRMKLQLKQYLYTP